MIGISNKDLLGAFDELSTGLVSIFGKDLIQKFGKYLINKSGKDLFGALGELDTDLVSVFGKDLIQKFGNDLINMSGKDLFGDFNQMGEMWDLSHYGVHLDNDVLFNVMSVKNGFTDELWDGISYRSDKAVKDKLALLSVKSSIFSNYISEIKFKGNDKKFNEITRDFIFKDNSSEEIKYIGF